MWNLPSISTYAFDKTGTLTQGRLSVVSSILRASSASALVSALVHGDSHPIARGISDSLDCDSAAVKDIRDQFGSTEVVLGGGIRTTFRGFPLLGGSAAFTGGDIDILAGSDRASLFLVTLGGWTVAAFALHDVVRPGSAALVAQLNALGRKVMMISGDQIGAVQYTAQQLGIDQDKAFGACSPATKLQLIEQLKTTESVCYIGDGVNDSLALVAADTSIAVSFAVDVAQAAADIVITSKSEDLGHAVFTSLTLATINRWHIKAALSWSVVYNILAILLASGAFVNIRIQPEWAGLGEIVSILPVIFIAFAVRITWRSRQITWLLRPLQSVSSGEPSGEG